MLKLYSRATFLSASFPRSVDIKPSVTICQDRQYHGNKKYMALRGRHRTRNVFAPVENVHAVRRGEKYRIRYRDKYGVQSDKISPIHKLPAPRWKWDYDLTEENTIFAKDINASNCEEQNTEVLNYSPLKDEQWMPLPWQPGSMRCGAVGIKLGVQYLWLKDGQRVSATLVQILDCHVIKYFSKEEYNGITGAVIVGAKNASPFYRNENYSKFCLDAGVPIKEKCFRFPVTENSRLKPGTPIYAPHFKVGQRVNLTAKSIGYGFAGVMQRFHMKGGPASHGATKWHRRVGSIASSGGRPLKGRRLPGQLGGTYETAFARTVLRINTRYNVIYVKGRIPGHVNAFVRISDKLNRSIHINSDEDERKQIGPFPTYYPDASEENMPENIYHDNVFNFDDPSIVFVDDKN